MKVLMFLLLSLVSIYAKEVEIVKYITNEKKPVIAIEFQNSSIKLEKMIKKDFDVIGHFDYDLLPNINNYQDSVDYDKYLSKFDYLVRANYIKNKFYILVYDLKNKKKILNKLYKIPQFKYYPFIIHSFAYDINKLLSMPDVSWIKRFLVYSVYTAPKESEIFIADYSLSFRKRLIQGGLNIFPKWADDKQTQIYYTSLKNKPTLYKLNIFTGKKERVISSTGMLMVSDVKDDKLLLTMAIDDQPDVYLYDTISKTYEQITEFKDIDVSAKFYGENSIAFISNRLGNPYVYEKDLETNLISKVLHIGKNQIALSTFNDQIVISSRESSKNFSYNTFNLFLSKKDDFVIKRLTFNGKNIHPQFSMDGSSIIFIKDFHFTSKIGIIRLKENLLFYYPISKKLQSLDW
jgi:TolB protein